MLAGQGDRRGRRSHTGYILFETLVAVALLSIGAVAANKAIYQASLVRAYARDATQARFLLEQLMGDCELKPMLIAGTTQGDFGVGYPGFRWECTVTLEAVRLPVVPRNAGTPSLPSSQYPARQLGKLRVAVMWSRTGRDFVETLETLVPPERVVVPVVEEDATFFGKQR